MGKREEGYSFVLITASSSSINIKSPDRSLVQSHDLLHQVH